jgi:hypothetical protein
VLRVGLPQIVAVLPWDVQPYDCSPTRGCPETPAHSGDLSAARATPSWVWRSNHLAVWRSRFDAPLHEASSQRQLLWFHRLIPFVSTGNACQALGMWVSPDLLRKVYIFWPVPTGAVRTSPPEKGSTVWRSVGTYSMRQPTN